MIVYLFGDKGIEVVEIFLLQSSFNLQLSSRQNRSGFHNLCLSHPCVEGQKYVADNGTLLLLWIVLSSSENSVSTPFYLCSI